MHNTGHRSLRHTLARRVRVLRVLHGWSQEELGEFAGLHRTYVGAVERAERNISIDNLEKIAVALQVSITSLFDIEDSNWLLEKKIQHCVKEIRASYETPRLPLPLAQNTPPTVAMQVM